ncbi:MAG: non-canonical purine NTP pyrophosphatase [Polyangiaceae bacterium]|nr:non-canonical purine NTP pyrophosphatase [Myxococcales bacterium]MCB9589272.1 non-canonical purine NTP pyrophosphatase [Polyangiaceae bacterium]
MPEALIHIVIATTDERKRAELQRLLADLPVAWLGVRELLGPDYQHPLGAGSSLEESARSKASAVCEATGMWCLSDASGLEVDALDGKPGARSEVFAHDRATDAENNAALLSALEDVHDEERHARFRAVLCLVSPWQGELELVDGSVAGRIARSAQGSGGFGYGPLLLLDELPGKTLSNISDAERDVYGHRARAVNALRPRLLRRLDALLDETERIAG